MPSVRIIPEEENVAKDAVDMASTVPMLKIRNKRTGEVKSIPATESQNYGIDPTVALERIKSQQELEQIATKGFEPTEEESIKTGVAGTIKEVLREFEGVPEEARGPITGQFSKRIPGISAEARTYEQTRQGIAGTLKKVVGETGVLTDRDIARITSLLPSVTATPEETKLRIEGLTNFLESQGINLGEKDKDELGQAVNAATNGEELGTTTELGNLERLAAEGLVNIEDLPEEGVGESAVSKATNEEGLIPENLETLAPGLKLLEPKGFLGDVEGIINTFTTQVDDLLTEQKKQVTEQDRGALWAAIETALPILEFSKIGEGGELTDVDKTAVEAAGEVGLMLLVPKIIDKVGSRFKTVKNLAEQRKAVAKSMDATIDGEQLISDTIKGLENVSPADEPAVQKFLLQTIEKYGGKKLTIDQAVDLYTQVNKAFTAAGKPGKSARAAFNLALRDSLRSQMPSEILKITDQIARRYALGKGLRRLLFPAALSGASFIGARTAAKAVGAE